MNFFLKKVGKLFLFLGLMGYFFVAFIPPAHIFSVLSDGAVATRCPLAPGSSSVCQMTPLEHIQVWQNMLTGLPPQDTLFLLCALLVVLLTAAFSKNFPLGGYQNFEIDASLLYIKNFFVPRPLKEMFSGGILHPKLF